MCRVGQDEVEGGRAFGQLGVGQVDGGGDLGGEGGVDILLVLSQDPLIQIFTTDVTQAEHIVAGWYLQTAEAVVVGVEQGIPMGQLGVRLERTGPGSAVGLLAQRAGQARSAHLGRRRGWQYAHAGPGSRSSASSCSG